jgi:hypothetical protein
VTAAVTTDIRNNKARSTGLSIRRLCANGSREQA